MVSTRQNTNEDKIVSNNALLKEFLLVVKQYYLNPDVAGKILEYSSIDMGIVKNQLSLIREWVKIQKDLSRNQDGYPIVQKLQEIELKYYKPIIYKLVDKEDSTSLKDLQQLFEDLASLSSSIGDDYAEGSNISALKYYSDAAIFYQYQYSIKQKIKAETESEIDYTNLSNLKQKILTFINGAGEEITHDVAAEIEKNKAFIANLREQTKSKLAEAKEKDNNVSILYKDIADQMKTFLAKLYNEAQNELSEPPCKFTVVGLGSMALNQMTPWSDLEFALLTENNDYKNAPDTRDYFRKLSHLVHFQIINIGETVLPFSKYKVELGIIKEGINFDLGGKTPLGRIDNDKPYDLIGTVDDLLQYVKNVGNKAEHIDKNLPFILEQVTYVTGDEILINNYKNLVNEFLRDNSKENGLTNHQFRAIKVLTEGTVEYDYLQVNNKTLFYQVQGDLERLQPKLDSTNEGALFNVKQEIYRLTDRLIYGLGMYYGLRAESAWNIVTQLENKELISKQGAKNLMRAANFATSLRLETYSHNNGQKDTMSTYQLATDHLALKDQQRYCEQTFYLQNTDALHHFYYVMIRLIELATDICRAKDSSSREKSENNLERDNLYDNSIYNKGLVHSRLLEYKDAIECMEKASTTLPDSISIVVNLHSLYSKVSDTKKQLYTSGLIHQYFDCEQTDPLILAATEDNLGSAFLSNQQYDEAIKYYKSALEKRLKCNDKSQNHLLNIAKSYANLGLACYYKGEFDKAVVQYTEIEKIGVNDTALLASTDNSMGMAYMGLVRSCVRTSQSQNINLNQKMQYNYDKAIEHYKSALEKRQEMYKNNNPNHHELASSYNNLGNAYLYGKKYKEAIQYFEQSLKIRESFYYSSQNHSSIAESYNNLGNACLCEEKYDEAIRYLDCALSVKLDANSCVLDIVRIFKMMGEVYFQEGQKNNTLDKFEDALDMFKLCLEIFISLEDNQKIDHLEMEQFFLLDVFKALREIEEKQVNNNQTYCASMRISLKVLENFTAVIKEIDDEYIDSNNYLKFVEMIKSTSLRKFNGLLDEMSQVYPNGNVPYCGSFENLLWCLNTPETETNTLCNMLDVLAVNLYGEESGF